MKKITSTYKEPMILVLLDSKFGRMSTSRNLLSGQFVTVEDNQISPECKALLKKKCITITDVVDKQVAPPAKSEAEELAELEKELLSDTQE